MHQTTDIYNTISAAIERAGEAMMEVDGVEVTTLPIEDRWAIYQYELQNMEREWDDRYPHAYILARMTPMELRDVWEGRA